VSDRAGFEPSVSLRQAMDQLRADGIVGSPVRAPWSRAGAGPAAMPLPLDVYATTAAVVVLAAAPGLQPDQLHVTFNQGTLVLSGTIRDVAGSDEAKGATWYAHELRSGQFRRAVGLPFDVNADQAQASFEQGIVKIVLPKAEQAKPKTIPITVGQSPQAVGPGR
jgi:HSP20 family protein